MKRIRFAVRQARLAVAIYCWVAPTRLWVVGCIRAWRWGWWTTRHVRGFALGPLVIAVTDVQRES